MTAPSVDDLPDATEDSHMPDVVSFTLYVLWETLKITCCAVYDRQR